MNRTNRLIVAAVFGLVLLAACGSSKSSTAGKPPAGTAGKPSMSTTAKPTAPTANPNAKEQLPPGDIPDNQVYVTYTPAAGGYSLSYPEGWSKRETPNAVTFAQYFNSIELVTTPATRAPTIASAQSLASSTLSSLAGYHLLKIDSGTRPAGPAVHIVYDATSPIDPVTGRTVTLEVERYLFWHKGTLLTIVLSSAKGSDNVDPWKTVTNSLVWK